MTRKLIIFGNGLGMALDSDHFLLSRALEKVWSLDDFLTDEQKGLIKACLDTDECPRDEEQLDILHQVASHCNSLEALGRGCCGWLNKHGAEFPIVTGKFIHKTAIELYNFDGALPDHFAMPLSEFIKSTKSHVATLNYDKLLYESFISTEVLKNYDSALIDGMLGRGFEAENLNRKYGKDFGYYMHLHGSPLFFDEDSKTVKARLGSLNLAMENYGPHIVLTHVKHKRSAILNSNVLTAYWHQLQLALHEATEVILFGYSGQDIHLNKTIQPHVIEGGKHVRVVEWSGAEEERDRVAYWHEILGGKATLLRLDRVLDFTDW
ncbi:hypothetical protein C8233_01700 [Halomonas sp. SF2003]|nr:hypothetical protein C8233_01700 [Halomonas sp. SF2003]